MGGKQRRGTRGKAESTGSTHNVSSASGTWVWSGVAVCLAVAMWAGQSTNAPGASRSGQKRTADEQKRFDAASMVLLRAAAHADLESVRKALAVAPSAVNAENDRGHTAVTVALESRHHFILDTVQKANLGRPYEEVAKAILDSPNYNVANCPSYYAVQYRNLPVLKMLGSARHAATLRTCMEEVDAFNETMLHIAARSKAAGFARVFVALLSADEWKSDPARNPGMRLLGISRPSNLSLPAMASAISAEDVRLLLIHANKAMVNKRGFDGNTPLHVAAVSGNTAGAVLLVDAGAELDARNDHGETPIQMAASGRLQATVSALIELGARSDLQQLPDFDNNDHNEQTERDGGQQSHSTDCDIPTVSASEMSTDRFFREFVSRRRAVRIRGASWPATENWALDRLVKMYGHVEVNVAPVPYASLYGSTPEDTSPDRRGAKTTIAEFFKSWMSHNRSDLPMYVFDSMILWKNKNLSSDLQLEWLDNANIILKQFILGPKGSGAYPHFHGAALNALAHGRKKWYIFPPGSAFFNVMHVANWTADHLPRLKQEARTTMLECSQLGGDLLFIPELWGHAIVNEEDSVAVAYEFHV